MNNISPFSRAELLLSKENMLKLKNASVIIFGVGGVGSYVAEGLARAGIYNITLVDPDLVDITNINRQLVATSSTVGKGKVNIMKKRILDINPLATVNAIKSCYNHLSCDSFDLKKYDYIIDAIDMVSSKILLVEKANECSTNIISAMGAGNKLDPTKFSVADIYSTSVCPLAKTIRQELRKRGISSLKVVYSTEKPITSHFNGEKQPLIGSVSFVPSVAGMIIAGEVVKDLIR